MEPKKKNPIFFIYKEKGGDLMEEEKTVSNWPPKQMHTLILKTSNDKIIEKGLLDKS